MSPALRLRTEFNWVFNPGSLYASESSHKSAIASGLVIWLIISVSRSPRARSTSAVVGPVAASDRMTSCADEIVLAADAVGAEAPSTKEPGIERASWRTKIDERSG